jgi:mRNA interferase HigB
MRVISRKILENFLENHADSRGSLESWYDHAKKSRWTRPEDIKNEYGDDTILGNNRAVFNIKGNDYRLVVAIHYKSTIIFIRFIGTHAEYDRIDALNI